MIRTIIATAMLTTALTATTATATQGDGDNYRPCRTEDSTGCVWDARHMGNGEGRSFFTNRNGRITYLPHRLAHDLLD